MLLRHTLFNLGGLGAPLLFAVVAIPPLIDALGAERFGLLTLVWAVVSYFGLFDLGLGRALTQQLSAVLARGQREQVGPLVGTALVVMVALGLVAGCVLAAIAPWGVGLLRAVPDIGETTAAVYAMAVAMPFIIVTSGLRGILEATHAFGVINAIRIPMGVFTFIGPLVVVIYLEPRLDWIAWVLTLGRIVACAIHYVYARRALRGFAGGLRPVAAWLRPLCISGGWLTVSNIVSPLMGYADRFVIGALVSATAVAYYVTPYEIVTKLSIVPGALTAVLFPTFAAQSGRAGAIFGPLFDQAVGWLLVALVPVCLALHLFAGEILRIWIDAEFAAHSAPLLQIFAVGVLINCLAHIPFTLIQSAGSPRTTALIHCAELPVFLLLLWGLTGRYGLYGAAVAWLLRMAADTLLMFILSAPLLGRTPYAALGRAAVGVAAFIVCAVVGTVEASSWFRGVWFIAVTGATLQLVARPLWNSRAAAISSS